MEDCKAIGTCSYYCTVLYPLPVCAFQDEVLTVFDKVALSSDEICNIVLGDSCAKGYDPWHQHWNVTIPGNKPPVTHVAPKVRVQIFYTILYDNIYIHIVCMHNNF